MTMTDNSPPPSPSSFKADTDEPASITERTAPVPIASVRPRHPTLPSSAINKSLYYHFPTPPSSPPTPSHLPRTIPSPRSPVRRTKHTRSASRSSPSHTRQRSSLSVSFHVSQLDEEEFGPPPFPAPTTPLPPIPGAPRVPYTTPAQERTRYSSYQLFDKLLDLERRQKAEQAGVKRYSAPPMRKRGPYNSAPVSRNISSDIDDLLTKSMRKVKSDQRGIMEEIEIRRDPRRER